MKTASAGEKVLYPELSYKIMQIVFEIHNMLSPGFTEDIYEEATICELESQQIPYEKQKPIEVYFKGKLMGIYRLDLVVDNKIILELKAVSALNDVYKSQLRSYLKATSLHLGILINFGSPRVQSVRIIL